MREVGFVCIHTTGSQSGHRMQAERFHVARVEGVEDSELLDQEVCMVSKK